ncbi:transcriptional regulator BetI [Xaviernesmea oryzae]|uniref:HTH-type transcriptional regulator BetI n=1 Tax=Xaviernesmea oryzae TaxID=464029 RepID=A0A1Q9B3K9_9HYPH|nr:transcriptional regulator BetI [Xaviernesmea oryzae]OLP62631.1 transcriptional regulator BetI [Xaviernesmea oryzae]SEM25411.1 transcriptional regulator, TetR family [Xaviernesmea oryzae]
MPKIGMEPIRRQALTDAALRAIADHGSLGVTMSVIARQAGVSPALAHHYFGSKDELLIATMRMLLSRLHQDVVAQLKAANGPRARLSILIRVSFQADQFQPETVAAWLAFYSEAQRSQPLRRLLTLYARRLRSNLIDALRALGGRDDAARIAEGAAAMIDGLYLRQALGAAPLGAEACVALVEDHVSRQLATLSPSAHHPYETARERDIR